MKRLLAVVALAVCASPAGAVAMPIDPPVQERPSVSTVAPHLPATGTDVAAPDQQSPVVSSAPAPVPVSGGSDFDWGDAGIGAGGGLVVLALSLGSIVTLRRRRVRRPAAIVG